MEKSVETEVSYEESSIDPEDQDADASANTEVPKDQDEEAIYHTEVPGYQD